MLWVVAGLYFLPSGNDLRRGWLNVPIHGVPECGNIAMLPNLATARAVIMSRLPNVADPTYGEDIGAKVAPIRLLSSPFEGTQAETSAYTLTVIGCYARTGAKDRNWPL